jgi:hypothetical protein
MVHETLHSFTPESEHSAQPRLWQTLSSSEQLEDQKTITYWRSASVEEHARVLEEVLDLADRIAQSKTLRLEHPDSH